MKEKIYIAVLIIFAIVMITLAAIYEYIKFQAYWKIAFGN